MTLAESLAGARVIDLAHPLSPETPVSPNHPPFRMGLIRRHGDVVREDGSSGANELFSLGGHTGTHIDALCHVAMEGRLHGGHDAFEASRGGRFSVLGAETIAPLLGRGVLLDIPAALGVDALEPAHPITAADLDTARRRADVDIRRGDVVLIRTGWPTRTWGDHAAFVGRDTGVPGVETTGAYWLAERGVRATGSDTIAFEHLAPVAGHARLPVHVILLVENGIHIIEMLNLEELSRAGTAEFAFVGLPLKIVGATGSPLRPVALMAQA